METTTETAPWGMLAFTMMISILLGYWAGKIGERNGRSFGLCFLLGFFIGLIGVLIVYVIGAPRGSKTRYGQPPAGHGPPPDPYQRRTRVCEGCKKLVQSDARFCPYCGGPDQA